MRRILIIAFDGVQPLDVSAVSSVFAGASTLRPESYEVVIASPRGGTVRGETGLSIADTLALGELDGVFDTIVVAGGSEAGLRTAVDDGLPEWLLARARTTRRIGSACTGSFLLAAAGLLDGRRSTTHWASTALLQQLCPATRVEGDSIFVIDGNVFTSAGVTSAIDLSLALVEQDLGRGVAVQIARQLVVYLRRPGGQSQYSDTLRAQAMATDTIRDVAVWIAEHLAEDLGVEALASRFAMSPRNFARRFRGETGETPARFITRLRVERAMALLAETDLAIRAIAARCGFGSVDSFERAFRSALGIQPREYRERFSSSLRIERAQSKSMPTRIPRSVTSARNQSSRSRRHSKPAPKS